MCAVTHRAKPYQPALVIKKSLDDQQSDCEATLQYQNIYFSLLYALQKVLFISLKKCVFYIIYKLKLALHVSFNYCPSIQSVNGIQLSMAVRHL